MSEETIHKSTRTRTRSKLAGMFRQVADALDSGDPVPVGADSIAVDPPAEAELEIDVEREDGMLTLEYEMAWPEEEGGGIRFDAGDDEADGDDEDEPASRATFELYEDNAGEYRWRLRHRNGNIIADSGEGYSTKANAKNGIDSVKTNAPGGAIEEQD
jgi:amphi-Trp domain-containing protein